MLDHLPSSILTSELSKWMQPADWVNLCTTSKKIYLSIAYTESTATQFLLQHNNSEDNNNTWLLKDNKLVQAIREAETPWKIYCMRIFTPSEVLRALICDVTRTLSKKPNASVSFKMLFKIYSAHKKVLTQEENPSIVGIFQFSELNFFVKFFVEYLTSRLSGRYAHIEEDQEDYEEFKLEEDGSLTHGAKSLENLELDKFSESTLITFLLFLIQEITKSSSLGSMYGGLVMLYLEMVDRLMDTVLYSFGTVESEPDVLKSLELGFKNTFEDFEKLVKILYLSFQVLDETYLKISGNASLIDITQSMILGSTETYLYRGISSDVFRDAVEGIEKHLEDDGHVMDGELQSFIFQGSRSKGSTLELKLSTDFVDKSYLLKKVQQLRECDVQIGTKEIPILCSLDTCIEHQLDWMSVLKDEDNTNNISASISTFLEIF